MQQRFCGCGCAIWVQYLFPNNDCRIIFKSKSKSMDCLTRCPSCGKKINIDELN